MFVRKYFERQGWLKHNGLADEWQSHQQYVAALNKRYYTELNTLWDDTYLVYSTRQLRISYKDKILQIKTNIKNKLAPLLVWLAILKKTIKVFLGKR